MKPSRNLNDQYKDKEVLRSRVIAMQNSESLGKLKYKEEFLKAIEDLTKDMSSSPDKVSPKFYNFLNKFITSVTKFFMKIKQSPG